MNTATMVSSVGFLLALGLPLTAPGQTPAGAAPDAPSAQQIIDALKPKKPRLRNLGVEPVQAPDAQGGAAPANTLPAPGPVPAAPISQPAPAPAAAISQPAPAPAAPSRDNAAASIDLALQFEFNSDRITPASQKTLEALAQALLAPELSQSRFRIEGHTDSKGLASYNQRLSRMRADQVKRILVKHRVGAERLVAQGMGSTAPINPNDSTAPENRRVRIVSLD